MKHLKYALQALDRNKKSAAFPAALFLLFQQFPQKCGAFNLA